MIKCRDIQTGNSVRNFPYNPDFSLYIYIQNGPNICDLSTGQVITHRIFISILCHQAEYDEIAFSKVQWARCVLHNSIWIFIIRQHKITAHQLNGTPKNGHNNDIIWFKPFYRLSHKHFVRLLIECFFLRQ